eukprot:1193705-Prorocentrum_minimum.AAC.1
MPFIAGSMNDQHERGDSREHHSPALQPDLVTRKLLQRNTFFVDPPPMAPYPPYPHYPPAYVSIYASRCS